MKINSLCKFVALAILALTAVGFVFTPATASAQIKGAQKLMPLRTAEDLSNLQPGDTIIMSCPKCKDSYASVVDISAKGMLEKSKNVPVHLCPTCETRIESKGQGKSAKDVLVHKCGMCGSEKVTGWIMKKDAAATAPAMEEKK